MTAPTPPLPSGADAGSDREVVVVQVGQPVPPTLGAAVRESHRAGRLVSLHLEPCGASLAHDERAGWELGVLSMALRAGVDHVVGADPVRLARVRAVTLALGTSGGAPT